MGRRYRVIFSEVTVSAAQDLIQITGAAGKIVKILRQWVDAPATTLPTNQGLSIRSRILPATVTNGSGGSSPTIYKSDIGDSSASFTAMANNTTKATTNGTAVIVEQGGDNIYAGHDHYYITPPLVGPSQAFVFELLSTVTGTVVLSGGVEVEEIGG